MGSFDAQLIPITGNEDSEAIGIPEAGLLIGRDEDCGHRIVGDGVSRHHARIVYVGQQLCIEDLGSTNGVIVNGHQVSKRKILKVGDVVQVCDFDFCISSMPKSSRKGGIIRALVLLVILGALCAGSVFWARFIEQEKAKNAIVIGRARILSEPEGVDVYDHGKVVGVTPLDFPCISEGKYWLLLRKEGYKDREIQLTVPQGEPVKIHSLEPLFEGGGHLNVITLPGQAEVYVDGKLRGVTKAKSDDAKESEPLRIGDVDLSIHHSVYIKADGRKSKAVTTNKWEPDVSIVLWRPDLLLTTKTGDVHLGMIRERRKDGSLVLAVTPSRSLVFSVGDIADEKKIMTPELRHSEGVRTLSNARGGIELEIDPFPGE